MIDVLQAECREICFVLKEDTAGLHPVIAKDTKLRIKEGMLRPDRPLNELLDDRIRPAEPKCLIGKLCIGLFPHTVVPVDVGMDIVDKWSYGMHFRESLRNMSQRRTTRDPFATVLLVHILLYPFASVLGREVWSI